MKSKNLFSVILIIGLMLVNLSASRIYGQMPKNKPATKQNIEYTCSMHPEVI
ncbi:MAG: hypothetical protein JXB17_03490 [Bacteroidales bacterium]|nr:hypothetical protein [Bacteroidales bacterium]